MSIKIVAVGGTGQMVLHYYLQLYLLGVFHKPFQAVVIDTDDILPSIQRTAEFFENLRYGVEPRQALGFEIPTLDRIRIASLSGDTVAKALTGKGNLDDSRHPVRALFDSSSLNQSTTRGLFARPALSSLLAVGSRERAALLPQVDSNVIVVGSIIGGTGGGLIAPVIKDIADEVENKQIGGVKIRAVLFGEYFTPSDNTLEEAVERFKSNQCLVLLSVREALKKLHSFVMIGGPGSPTLRLRNPEQEKRGKNIPWAQSDGDAFWRGVKAVEYLSTESAMEWKDEFEDREIPDTTPLGKGERLELANNRCRHSVQVIETLIDREIVGDAPGEPLANWLWGSNLGAVLAHYWRIAQEAEPGSSDFADEVQQALKKLWGKDDQEGLSWLFPAIDRTRRVRPKDVKRIDWPGPRSAGVRDGDLFSDRSTTADRAAATLIYWALRRKA